MKTIRCMPNIEYTVDGQFGEQGYVKLKEKKEFDTSYEWSTNMFPTPRKITYHYIETL